MATDARAIGFLDLNIKGFQDAIDTAKKALAAFGVAFSAYKIEQFFEGGIKGAIEFGNEAYFAAQKLNGYDPGKLLIVQKALQSAGLSAEEARGDIEEFAQAGRPLEQMFKGGASGFAEALTRSAKEYGTQAEILSTSAEKFAFVQQQLNNLGTKLQGFFLGLASKIVDPLSGLLDQLDQIDLVSMGERFGEYITDAVNVIRGLIDHQDLFEAIGLALQLGFETAVNYLVGGINAAMDILLKGNLWSGIAEVAIGALSVIGTFLTNIILDIGKLLVATVEAAFARLSQKYAPILKSIATVSGGPMGAALYGAATSFGTASTDVGENLKRNESNNLIQSQEQGSNALISKSLEVASAGLKKLEGIQIDFKTGQIYDTSKLSEQLDKILNHAQMTGEAMASKTGNKTPVFSEHADSIHVIRDSLAAVGGGGRYIRTGLSISEKAAMDSALLLKQQNEIQAKYLPFLGKLQGPPQSSSMKGG